MFDSEDDLSLVQQSRDGNMRAFRTIVDRHQSTVAGVVKSMVGDGAEAEDVGQEVFIRFYHAARPVQRGIEALDILDSDRDQLVAE